MELKELKVIFDTGALKSAVVTPAAMEKGYMLIVKDRANKEHIMLAQRSEKHEPRIFKSIDAAINNASKVGFKEIKVVL